MIDPFRGELTVRYLREDDLRWAARERLSRESRLASMVREPAERPGQQLRRGLHSLRERWAAIKDLLDRGLTKRFAG
jgi:hypothetical protein